MNSNTTSGARIAALAVGYIFAMVVVLSFFTIPFCASLVLMAVGTFIAFLSDRTIKGQLMRLSCEFMINKPRRSLSLELKQYYNIIN